MQYLIVILFIPLLAVLAEIYSGMELMQKTAFQNQNQNQKYALQLKTNTFRERWSHCEKLCPTNFTQPQSIVASNHKLCKEGRPCNQTNAHKNPAFT